MGPHPSDKAGAGPALKTSSTNRQKKGKQISFLFHSWDKGFTWMMHSTWASLSSRFGNGAPGPRGRALAQGCAESRLSKETQHKNCDIPLLATLVLLLSACYGVWRQQQPSAYFWVEAERSDEAKKHIPFLEAACSLLSKRVKTLHECFMNQTCVHFNDKASLAIWAGKGEAENLQIPAGMFLDTNLFPHWKHYIWTHLTWGSFSAFKEIADYVPSITQRWTKQICPCNGFTGYLHTRC